MINGFYDLMVCKESRIILFSLFNNSHSFSVQASLCESLITLITNHQLLKKQSYRQLFNLDLVGSILLLPIFGNSPNFLIQSESLHDLQVETAISNAKVSKEQKNKITENGACMF